MDWEFSSGRYVRPCSKNEVKQLLGPFQLSPLSLVAKPGKVGKIKQYTISPFHAHHKVIYPLLITLLTLIYSPAPGGPSLCCVCSFGISLKAHKPQYVTLLRLTTQLPSSQLSGPVSLSSYKSPISSRSTPTTISASPRQGAFMGQLLMPVPTFFVQLVLAHSRNGLMITFSSGFCANTSQPIEHSASKYNAPSLEALCSSASAGAELSWHWSSQHQCPAQLSEC